MSLTNISCGNCGVAFCLPTSMYHARVQDGRDFHCPNGHVISYRPSENERRIETLEEEVRRWEQSDRRRSRQYDEIIAQREELIGLLKECPGGCGWRSRRQVPRDQMAMGRGIERVRRDVAEHLVEVHGARPLVLELTERT